MTYRFPALALTLSLIAAGCSSTTSPTSATSPRFTTGLLPSNEVPAITNADAGGSGTVTVTMNLTKDATGTITAATANFTVTVQGFPAGTVLTGAHIHTGAAGGNGAVIWSLALGVGEITLNAAGAGTFTKTLITPAALATAQAIIDNPAAFYFNVHTQLNTGGAIRGQLIRAN